MTFKYLLLLDKCERYDSIKDELHMVLDKYTLNWYNSLPNVDIVKEWSKINKYEDYWNIQKNIKTTITSKSGCSYCLSFKNKKTNTFLNDKKEIRLPNNIFDAEYIIWEGEKNKEKYSSIVTELSKYFCEGKDKDNWFINDTLETFLAKKIQDAP